MNVHNRQLERHLLHHTRRAIARNRTASNRAISADAAFASATHST
ncbi:hypothetical protein C791_1136 [Amycolatopsis azurea DSM 43854]|uniref:Uncharacterized protein n=1 Tax=Amycolatopsis azurea DSM 43854 TaxID=1238180 RepID=M2QRP0_9PSEU|nr:hypothetical protein C791_1136 [Amycolatopsis azurea DSM 43854]